MHEKPKTEFSKKLLYVVFGITGIVILFTMYMIWETNDLTPLSYLIPALFVEVASASSLYYWKAKKENEIKLSKIYGEYYKNTVDKNEAEDYEVNNENYY